MRARHGCRFASAMLDRVGGEWLAIGVALACGSAACGGSSASQAIEGGTGVEANADAGSARPIIDGAAAYGSADGAPGGSARDAAGGSVARDAALAEAGPSRDAGSPHDAGSFEDASLDASFFADAGTVCFSGQTHTHNLNNDNWAGALTLFISYSADTRSQTVDEGFTSAEWNAAVNSFDVQSFVSQVVNTGAKNILLMLGQNTGYYCSPNSTYEAYAGVAPNTRCSARDLPMELADALSAQGIGLYLYLPEDVGWGDTAAAQGFGLSAQAVGNWVVDGNFTPKWNAVIHTWAARYGSKVRGWFFDGYEIRWGVTSAMAQTYQDTCRAANPCAIVTFNGTNSNAVSDTERGETQIDPTTGLPAKGLPSTRWDSAGLQTMWDFPLQAAWGQEIADNSPAIYTNANLKAFIAAATKAQTVFALDCRTSLAGALSIPIYNQLMAIKP